MFWEGWGQEGSENFLVAYPPDGKLGPSGCTLLKCLHICTMLLCVLQSCANIIMHLQENTSRAPERVAEEEKYLCERYPDYPKYMSENKILRLACMEAIECGLFMVEE
eukprot:scaffold85911_cov18-Tisochrysis_lutea.AAC.3